MSHVFIMLVQHDWADTTNELLSRTRPTTRKLTGSSHVAGRADAAAAAAAAAARAASYCRRSNLKGPRPL